MKKMIKQVRLAKETLHGLESGTMVEVVGGINTQAGRICTVGCPNTRGTCSTIYC